MVYDVTKEKAFPLLKSIPNVYSIKVSRNRHIEGTPYCQSWNMQAFLCFIHVFVQSFRYEFSYHVLLENIVVYGERMRRWQVSCRGLSGCCYTIGLDTCAFPSYCYSKNIAPFIVSQLLTTPRNNRLYISLFWGVYPWRQRYICPDVSKQCLRPSWGQFRTVCGEESITEVKIPIGKVHPVDLVIIRMVVSRGGWYSSHSQCLVFVGGSSTQVSLRSLLMRVRRHTRPPLGTLTTLSASFTIQTFLMI